MFFNDFYIHNSSKIINNIKKKKNDERSEEKEKKEIIRERRYEVGGLLVLFSLSTPFNCWSLLCL